MTDKKILWMSSARFLFSYSENVIHFLLPIMTYRLFDSVRDAGIVVALHGASRLIGYPISGVMCDHLGEKALLLTVSFVRGLTCLLFCGVSVYLAHDSQNWMLLFLNGLSILDGFLGGSAQIAFDSLGPKLYRGERFRAYQAAVQSADQGALVGAPVSSAFLLSQFGQSGLLGGLGGLFWVVFGLLTPAMHSREGGKTPFSGVNGGESEGQGDAEGEGDVEGETSRLLSQSSPFEAGEKSQQIFSISQWKNSFTVIAKHPVILLTLILTLLDNFLLGLYGALSTPLGLGLLSQSEQSLGGVVTLSYFFSLIAILSSHGFQERKGTLRLLGTSYVVSYLGFILLGTASHFLIFALALIFIESSCASGLFALRLVRAHHIPSQHFGKISGVLTLIQQVTLPCGGFVVASLQDPQSLQRVTLYSSLVLSLVTLGLFYRLSGDLSRSESQLDSVESRVNA